MKLSIKSLFVAACAVWVLSSCSTPKDIVYFQDTYSGSATPIAQQKELVLRPGDKVSIFVNSRDPQLVILFNKPYTQVRMAYRATGNANNISNASEGLLAYTIDRQGNIEFPVLGSVHAAGLTRAQLTEYLQTEIRSRNLANDAVVTVEFINLEVSILGDVNKPGRISITRDNFTVLDAISSCGDVALSGMRTNVKVYRAENGMMHTYELDFTNAAQTFSSPAFYLQQNDIIYVEPNKMRLRSTTVNGNAMQSPSFWISIASFLASLGVIIFK